MKNILLILPLLIVGCSNLEENLNVICESGFHDKSLTFDLKNNVVSIRKTLNEYGYQSKKILNEGIASIKSSGEELPGESEQQMLDVFDEEEITRHIRSADEGFIVFGLTKEINERIDMEWTLNRATLKMKVVRRMDESIIPKNSGVESIKVSYEECKQPVI
jgi:hypothetical protein